MRATLAIVLALLPVSAVAADSAPTSPAAALLDRARLWDDRNRPQLARETLEKLFRMAPEHADGLAMLAQVELRAERPAMARAALDRLRRAQPGHPAIASLEAGLRLTGADRDRLAEARQLAQQSRLDGRRNVRPKALAAYRALFPGGKPEGDLALEYWQLVGDDWNDWEAARKGLAELARQHPDNLRYRFALAEHEASRLPINRRALQIVIDMTRLPEFERQARATWRRVMQRLDPSPEHARLIEDYLQHEPNDILLQDKLKTFVVAEAARRRLLADPAYRARMEGLALLEKNRPEEAEPLLEAALRDRPDDAELIGSLGLLRLRQGHHALAFALFRQALKLQPDQTGKWGALEAAARYWGLLREAGDARSGGDYALAEDKLAEALVIDPREPQARLVLARVHADRGRPDLAEASYRQVLAGEPANRAALGELLDLMVREGRREEARATLDGLAPTQRTALGRDVDVIRAGLLRAEADVLVADQRLAEASTMLEQAISLDPESAWLRHDLGRVRLARGNVAGAFAPLDELLARRPDDGPALHALALLQSSAEQGGHALATLERLAPDQRDAKLTRFQRQLWSEVRLQQVRAEALAGRGERARRLLDDTGRQAESDGELVPRIARAWSELGEPRRGLDLFARLRAAGRSLTIEQRLDEADLLAETGRPDVLRTAFPDTTGLTPAQRERLAGLREKAALQTARRQVGGGDRNLALASLAAAVAELGDRPGLLREQARLESGRGAPMVSARLLQRALEKSPDDTGLRLDLADALIAAGQTEAAVADIDRRLAVIASQTEDRDEDGLRRGRVLLASGGDNAALMLAQVKALRLGGHQADADAALRRLLASSAGLPPRERIELAEAAIDLGWLDSARPLLDELRRDAPEQSRLLMLAGRLARAEGRETEALGWQQRGYERELVERIASASVRLSSATALEAVGANSVDLAIAGPVTENDSANHVAAGSYVLRQLALRVDQNAHWLSAGMDTRRRVGSPGMSQLRSTEVYSEGLAPMLNGDHWFARADLIRLDAGTRDENRNSRFAAQVLCNICFTPTKEFAEALGLSVGWMRRELKIDLGLPPQGMPLYQESLRSLGTREDYGPIGLTPVGFEVKNWVGGISDKGDWGPFSWSAELSRRSVTSSLLSWAGMRDEVTNQSWGGVVAKGMRIGLSADRGASFGGWSSFGLHRLTGRHVVDNQRRQMMAGGYWRAINDDDRLFSIGVTGMYMTHQRNAGEYTFGHGGYYSPEWYRSLSLPITWAQRFTRLSYAVRYAASRSRSFTAAAPFFPNDPALQARAEVSGSNATYAPSDPDAPTASGKSLHISLEYQMTPRLFLGGRLEVERSPDYAPDRLMVYLRYNLDRPAAQAVKLLPEAFLPYSQF